VDHASICEVHGGRGRWAIQKGMEGLALMGVCEDVNAFEEDHFTYIHRGYSP
jgi:hypothetical protein